MAQGLDQRLSPVVRQTGHGLFPGLGGEIPHPIEQRPGGGGQVETEGPTVAGIGPARHQAGFLQSVDQAGQRDRLDLQAFGERDLIHALLARQVGERLPLGLGQPELLRPAIEVPPQQARHVVHQEADALVGITHRGHPRASVDK